MHIALLEILHRLREGSFLGVPAVIVGDRQEGREHGSNIVFSDYDKNDIRLKIESQLDSGINQKENLFGDGTAGQLIADKLSVINLDIKKRMTY